MQIVTCSCLSRRDKTNKDACVPIEYSDQPSSTRSAQRIPVGLFGTCKLGMDPW